jgi:hypothetical protein
MVKVNLQLKSTGFLPIAQRAVAKKHLNLLLDKLPEGSTAYVAGGAPRDWHHGWGCRDIDIFYSVPEKDRDSVVQSFNEQYTKLAEDTSDYGYGVNNNELLHAIHEYDATLYSPRAKSTQYTKVQLIMTTKDPMEVITDFPISLSRIWMDPEGDINCDIFYAQSYNNHIINEMNESHGWNYVYLDKILGRFSTYAFSPIRWGGGRRIEDKLDIGF